MANRTSSKPLRIMTSTSGSLGWLAACAIGGNILALIDRTPNGRSHTAILPALLDPQGQLLHVAQDLNVDNPRFADIVQTGQDEALIAVMSRPDGSGPLAIPHFYRCSIKPGQLRVKKLGVWRGGTSILSTSLFLRHNDRLGFACLFAKSVRQELTPDWKLAYGTIDNSARRPEPQTIAEAPSENVQSIATAMSGPTSWLFAAAVGRSERIELWHDTGTGKVLHRATLATASPSWPEISNPLIIPHTTGHLVLWRQWNGKQKKDLCDGSIWYVQTGPALRSISPPKRWSPDRAIPCDRIRLCPHAASTSLFWQNGLSSVHSPMRWSFIPQSTPTPVRPRPLAPPLPSHILQTPTGFLALRDHFRMTPYQWSLTTEPLTTPPTSARSTSRRYKEPSA